MLLPELLARLADMLHNLLSTAIALRGQTWLGQTWLAHLAHVPTLVGGIFRIFPNS